MQKYTIIELLKKKHIIGFLGEGFNDVPALKLAHVALAVEGAADIAQDASDIILLNKSLEVVTDGIIEGRKTFTNSLKYVKATLAANFGNFFALAFSSLTIPFLPLLPLQILLVNLLSDFPMISIATDSVDVSELKKPTSFNIRELLFLMIVLGLVSTFFDFAFFGFFVHFGEHTLQTMWFIGSILTEFVFLFSIRTHKLFFKAKRPSSIVIILTCIATVLTLGIPFSSFGQSFFGFVRPSGYFLFISLFLVVAYFISSEIVKLIYYHVRTTTPEQPLAKQ